MEHKTILKAACFAAIAHSTQKRKALDQPYINHLIRVGHLAADAELSTDAIAAALLHDIVEDTTTTFQDLEKEFSPRIVELVRFLTKWWPDDATEATKTEGKQKYYSAILTDGEAIELKLLDRADNLRDMVAVLPHERPWAERYLRKTDAEVAPLFAKSKNPKVRAIYTSALDSLRQALTRTTLK